MAHYLPVEIWEKVTLYISLQDFFSLRGSNRSMCNMLKDKKLLYSEYSEVIDKFFPLQKYDNVSPFQKKGSIESRFQIYGISLVVTSVTSQEAFEDIICKNFLNF